MDRGPRIAREKNPRETTNLLSLISFFYIIKLFKKGYAKALDFTDLYEVLQSCRSNQLGSELDQQWAQEKLKNKRPSLSRVLISCFGKTFFTLGLLQLVVRLITTICSPYAESRLIAYFNPGQTELDKQDAINFSCAVIGLHVFQLFFSNNFQLYVLALGLRVKAGVASLLYRKSLKLKSEALSHVTVGKVTTIINRDVEIFQQFITQGNEVWIALVQTGIICYLIYRKIGLASWAGVSFFFLVLPLQILIGKLGFKLRLKCSRKSDERLEVTQEVLSAIKIIKMYTWEKYFEQKIHDARKTELAKLHRLFQTKIWIFVIAALCSNIAFYIFIMTYVWMENNVTAETVYYIWSCFGDLENSLSTSIPFGFSKGAEIFAVIKRCEDVMQCEEVTPRSESKEIMCRQVYLSQCSIKIDGKTILHDVNLNITKGLNIVIGNTGSGKSTLLKGILQEYEMIGTAKINGTISYASQEPWLFPASIKNNIVFGEKFYKQRYQRVLKICCLDYDLQIIERGDNTIIGERGINLSKGQQARINLARALYKKSDIYLLDDCLASLDAHVSDQIFKELVQHFLKNKICVFVTNNMDYAQEGNQIIVVENGTVRCTPNKTTRKATVKYIKYERDQSIKAEEKLEKEYVYHEDKNSGKVALKDYKDYILFGGGFLVFGFIMALFTAAQGASSYSEKLFSIWLTLEQNVSNFKTINETNTSEYEELFDKRTNSLGLYSGIFLTSIVLYVISIFAFFCFVKVASENLHQAMLKSIINSTMNFFDNHYIGNILTRFSKDCVTLDEYLPFNVIECIMVIFEACGNVILLTTIELIYLLQFLGLATIAYFLRKVCQPTTRNLQRLHVMARCPIIGHVNSSLSGLSTIRTSNVENVLIDEFDKYQDQYTSSHFMMDNTLTALSFSVELLSSIFITLIIVQLVASDFDHTIGDVGLAISQVFALSGVLSGGIRLFTDCENLMTSTERMLEYVRLEQEDKKGIIMPNWPTAGCVEFSNVGLSYNNTNKQMLKDVSFKVAAKERIGIVGRTGAGKSSIVSSLLRMYQTQGKIMIDGIDIEKVSLNYLRNHISVIPQDPFLFSGTIKENLDPLNQYSDAEIWKVLSDLKLKGLIETLDMKVNKGVCLSAGQKQLLCLARIILRRNKIVILDEATANVDAQTENFIHEIVLKQFLGCTLITITHRLISVMNCDKVIVLKNGEITEYDQPARLLDNQSSFFQKIVK